MFKKFIALFLTLSIVIPGFTAVAEESRLKAFDVIWLKDISGYDLRDKGDILTTTTFNSDQKWPSADKMPDGFDPKKLLEWGKDPGLGIRDLNKMGYTGKGVNIAYIDQPLRLGHVEYKKECHYG